VVIFIKGGFFFFNMSTNKHYYHERREPAKGRGITVGRIGLVGLIGTIGLAFFIRSQNYLPKSYAAAQVKDSLGIEMPAPKKSAPQKTSLAKLRTQKISSKPADTQPHLQSTVEYDSLISNIQENAQNIEPSNMTGYLNQSLEQILKQWEGTRWGMYGDALKPKSGRIACGYLGIRAMEGLGYKYNPDDLGWQTVAQESTAWLTASNIIKASCSQVDEFRGRKAFNKVKKYLETQQDGFYMVGLDTHFGFLQKNKNELYFIHSSEKPHGKVVKEKSDEVWSLKYSNNYVIGKLFTEDTLQQYFQKEKKSYNLVVR
jgi:hypothetical protein